jgi:hypothetical protein
MGVLTRANQLRIARACRVRVGSLGVDASDWKSLERVLPRLAAGAKGIIRAQCKLVCGCVEDAVRCARGTMSRDFTACIGRTREAALRLALLVRSFSPPSPSPPRVPHRAAKRLARAAVRHRIDVFRAVHGRAGDEVDHFDRSDSGSEFADHWRRFKQAHPPTFSLGSDGKTSFCPATQRAWERFHNRHFLHPLPNGAGLRSLPHRVHAQRTQKRASKAGC